MKNDYEKVFTVDTSSLIDSPALGWKIVEGNNLLVVPWRTHAELTLNKKDHKIGKYAKQALSELFAIQKAYPGRVVLMGPNWEGIATIRKSKSSTPILSILSKNDPDDVIIATALSAYKREENHDKPNILLTHDTGMKLKAEQIQEGKKTCLLVQEWEEDKGLPLDQLQMPIIKLPKELFRSKQNKVKIPISAIRQHLEHFDAPRNTGVLIQMYEEDPHQNHGITHVAIRSENELEIISKEVSVCGLKQKEIVTDNGTIINWEQMAAIKTLLNTRLDYIAFLGEAGTGKTLLAIAYAFHALFNNEYERLYITREPISDTTLGYVPGSFEDKMSHWVQGMMDNISVLRRLNPEFAKRIDFLVNGRDESHSETVEREGKGKGKNKEVVKKKEPENGRGRRVEILSLEHIRGRNLENSIIIIDEFQNTRPKKALTYVTRLAEGSKMILTGDPTQIDVDYLTEERNGLVWFVRLMLGDPCFGFVKFNHSVRNVAVRRVLERMQMMDKRKMNFC
jgi:predicted ribonuclease YlaK